MVTTVEEGLEACKSIGFPVMIKASEVWMERI
jgi:biotin carboxylase